MKTLLLICLCSLLSIDVWSQETFEVEGKIQKIAYHQGGVELLPEEMAPFALSNFTMYVVAYNGPELKPTILKKIISDSLGNFSVKLPEGQYGFLISNNTKDLLPGCYLPGMKTDSSDDTFDIGNSMHHDYWYLNQSDPLRVGPDNSNSVTITHYNVSVCYKCP